MSVSETDENKPDDYDTCSIHLMIRPCPYCRDEAADRTIQDRLDRKEIT